MNHCRSKLFGILPAIASVLLLALAPVATPAQSMPEVKDLPVRTEMPDALTMADGTKVTTPEQWRQRREEMRAHPGVL